MVVCRLGLVGRLVVGRRFRRGQVWTRRVGRRFPATWNVGRRVRAPGSLGLVLVAVPGVNLVLGPVAMMVAGLRDGSRRAEPGRSNGRRAASWGLTFLLGEALLIGAQLYIGRVVSGWGERVTLFPWGLPAVFALILMVSHFVVCIVQGVRARRGGVTRFGGIPFFR